MKAADKKFKTRSLVLLFFTGVLLFTSCGRYEEIQITNVSNINIKGFDNNALLVSLDLEIDNPSMHRIKITDLDTRFFLGSTYVGKLTVENDVVLKVRSKEVYTVNIRIRVANFLGTAMNLMSLKTGQKIQIRLEGTATAKTAVMKRTIPINESREVVL